MSTGPSLDFHKKNKPFYRMVKRVPDEKGKKTYTKLVSAQKADALVNGTITKDFMGNISRKLSSRKYEYV